MRYFFLIITTFFGFCQAFSQSPIQGDFFELDENLTGTGNYIYEAGQYVLMKPGFEYDAITTNDLFEAYINPFIVELPDEGDKYGGPNPGDDGVVGTLPGSLKVTPTGAANYSIPIEVPPGINGMEPSISLIYNSQGGNGYLGVGWSLSGLSAISRVGTTIYNDGFVDGVDFDDNDKFVLDGNRLIAVSGTYGGDGTEYRTEIETFSKIVSRHENGVLAKFEVWTKDGQYVQYGYTTDSRFEYTSSSDDVLIWHINKVVDRRTGNYIEFIYNETTGTDYAEITIDEILYTKNDCQNCNLTVNKIKFNYTGSRLDPHYYYIQGGKIQQTKLLDNISCLYNGATVYRKYSLNYNTNTALASRLESIELSGTKSDHFNATTFTWGNNPHSMDSTLFEFYYQRSKFCFFDFNADGRTDRIRMTYQYDSINNKIYEAWAIKKKLKTGGFSQDISFDQPISERFQYFVKGGDLNGDGYNDLLRITQKIYDPTPPFAVDFDYIDMIMLGGESGFTLLPTFLENHTVQIGNLNNFLIGDFNGDGIAEFVTINKNHHTDNIKFYKYKETAPYYEYICSRSFDFGNEKSKTSVIPGNFNRDGKVDLLLTRQVDNNENTCYIFSVDIDEANWDYIYVSGYPTVWHRIFPAEFNQDGITDIITYNWSNPNPEWEAKCFNGKDSWVHFDEIDLMILGEDEDPYEPTVQYKFGIIVDDYNGDGRSDVLQLHKENDFDEAAFFKIIYSNGSSFVSSENFEGEIFCRAGINLFGGSHDNKNLYTHIDFNADGVSDLFGSNALSKDRIYYFDDESNLDKNFSVNKVTDGHGFMEYVKYVSLPNHPTYLKGSSANFPVIDIEQPIKVVLLTYNSLPTYSLRNYNYKGAKIHLQGKGFLGFTETVTEDKLSNTQTTSVFGYNPTYFNTYLLNQKTEILYTSTVLSQTEFSNLVHAFGNKRILPYQDKSYTEVFDTDGDHVKSVKTDFSFDLNYGLVEYVKKMTSPEPRSITSTDDQFYFWEIKDIEYDTPDPTNHIFGFVTDKTETMSFYPHTDYIYKSTLNTEYIKTFIGTSNFPVLWKEIVENDPQQIKSFTKVYTYDDFGNITSITSSAPNDPIYSSASRLTNFTYSDSYGYRFMTEKTSVGATNHVESYTYDPVSGDVLTSTDMNGLTASFEYDGFGNRIKEEYADGVIRRNTIKWVTSPPAEYPDALYFSWTRSSGSGANKVYFDKFGNKLREESYGIHNGQNTKVFLDYTYDLYNRLKYEYLPYFDGEKCETCKTYYQYDNISRPLVTTHPDGTQTTYLYDELSTKVTHEGQSNTKITNVLGWPLSSEDSDNNIVNYAYSMGSRLTVININGNSDTQVGIHKDEFGDRISMSDPSLGNISYEYNAFGELVKKTDSKGTITEYEYDEFGRVTNSIIGDDANYETTYVYDTEPNGIGELSRVYNGYGHESQYHYDGLGRIIQKIETIPGKDLYAYSFTYNEYGRPLTMEYPGGFKVLNHYNSIGLRDKIYHDTDKTLLWEKKDEDATGITSAFELAAGNISFEYVFDDHTKRLESITTNSGLLQDLDFVWLDNENLQYRYKNMGDPVDEIKEEFIYDALNRLTDVKLNGDPKQSITYDNSGLGNIVRKTGVTTVEDIKYGPLGGDPDASVYALTQIPQADQAFDGSLQEISYTVFDKVSSISQGNYEMDIFYGTDLQRLKQEIRLNQSIVETRFFVGNLYEMLELNGGSQVKKLNYLSGPDGVFAIYIEDEINGNRFNYVLKDHLGSYNVIADENGNKLEELSFDAWGQRRNPNDWKNENVPTSFLFRRGFTGHEHLDEFGLINMNGRVYDDALGRFLSPDPFVQMPDFSQNFNRYSYCLNNPLIFTDPSGEIIWAPIIIGAALGTYMGGAIANEGNFNPFEWDYSSGKTWGYMLGGAIVGGLSGYVGGAIASAEIPMSNTLGIAGSSLTNSIGTNIYTGGETDISISLGVVSYNFTQGEMGYLGKKGNSALENIGYTFGALANLSDAVSLFSGGGQNVDVNSASTKDDWWGHSSITDKNENTLVSIGPDSQVQKAESLSDTWKNSIKGAKIWDSYVGDKGTWSTRINNVSTSAINNYASGITRWDLLLNSCVGHTTKALMRAGIPTIYAFHPHMLNVQLFIRQLGIYSSSYLYQFE